jgi:hypothetical protein
MKRLALEVTFRPPSPLQPAARNARTHSRKQVQQIAASIREFGFVNPVLVDDEDRVIAGHARIEAAKLLGLGNMAAVAADGSIHFVCMDWRHMTELLKAGAEVYTELKNLCVWNKDSGGMGAFYRSKHELVFVFKKGTAPHINTFGLGEKGRYRTNVWDYAGANSFRRGRAGTA